MQHCSFKQHLHIHRFRCGIKDKIQNTAFVNNLMKSTTMTLKSRDRFEKINH